MIANVSPSEKSILETLNTLRFAQNCKKVKNSAKINEDMSGSIEKLKQEIVWQQSIINQLMLENSSIKNLSSVPHSNDDWVI